MRLSEKKSEKIHNKYIIFFDKYFSDSFNKLDTIIDSEIIF